MANYRRNKYRRRFKRRPLRVRLYNPKRNRLRRTQRRLKNDKYFTRFMSWNTIDVDPKTGQGWYISPNYKSNPGFMDMVDQYMEFKIHKIVAKITPGLNEIYIAEQGLKYAYAPWQQANGGAPSSADIIANGTTLTYGKLMNVPWAKSKRITQAATLVYKPKTNMSIAQESRQNSSTLSNASVINFPWVTTQNSRATPLPQPSGIMLAFDQMDPLSTVGKPLRVQVEFFLYVTFRKRRNPLLQSVTPFSMEQ
ncbi:putative cap [Duck associated cyclovirus 1]|uniref:Putative cap n=1 Tax=Duck associated cyclovirus 1 TaxID=2006585 RepID=A0A3S9LX24_9CIRC|nr:putative cap [Duck associated cyclovirus 1]AZQ25383.1 putative cap [Duck associated cyclovirus 1]